MVLNDENNCRVLPVIGEGGAQNARDVLPVPYDARLPHEYLPATLTSDDYPALIPVGGQVDTLAVSTVMIAYNWPKGTDGYRRIAKFVDRFFAHFAALQRAATLCCVARAKSRRRPAELEAVSGSSGMA